MKIQDVGFLVVFLITLGTRSSRLTAIIGLICLIGAIPLFAFWIFFTAQRLVMYAAAFFLLSIIFQVLKLRRAKE